MVRELVVRVGVRFFIDTLPTLGFYTKRLSQNSSQLSHEIVWIRTRLGCGSSEHHLNWMQSKGKVWQAFITKATVFLWAMCVVLHHVVVGVVQQESGRTTG
jgi:hypothetical protein